METRHPPHQPFEVLRHGDVVAHIEPREDLLHLGLDLGERYRLEVAWEDIPKHSRQIEVAHTFRTARCLLTALAVGGCGVHAVWFCDTVLYFILSVKYIFKNL